MSRILSNQAAQLKALYNMKKTSKATTEKLHHNYLVESAVAERFVASLGDLKGQTVVEICPGPGLITEQLLKTNATGVVCVEESVRFDPPLQKLAAEHPGRLSVVFGDMKRFGRFGVLDEAVGQKLDHIKPKAWSTDCGVRLVGIFSGGYGDYLAARLLHQIGKRYGYFAWGRMTADIMMPMHVYVKISAQPESPKRARLSVACDAFCDLQLLTVESKSNFAPAPKDDMAVVRIQPKSNPPNESHADAFEFITSQLFVNKKTTLLKAIRSIGPGADSLISEVRLNPKAIVSSMPTADFIALTEAFVKWPSRPIIDLNESL